jgi:hypothetical protein
MQLASQFFYIPNLILNLIFIFFACFASFVLGAMTTINFLFRVDTKRDLKSSQATLTLVELKVGNSWRF